MSFSFSLFWKKILVLEKIQCITRKQRSQVILANFEDNFHGIVHDLWENETDLEGDAVPEVHVLDRLGVLLA